MFSLVHRPLTRCLDAQFKVQLLDIQALAPLHALVPGQVVKIESHSFILCGESLDFGLRLVDALEERCQLRLSLPRTPLHARLFPGTCL